MNEQIANIIALLVGPERGATRRLSRMLDERGVRISAHSLAQSKYRGRFPEWLRPFLIDLASELEVELPSDFIPRLLPRDSDKDSVSNCEVNT